MTQIDWDKPKTFKRDGLTFAYWETGPKDSSYPTLVFSHGFPELAFSWRFQLEGLAERGFHCVAMDQRGYGQSACPEAIEAYDMEALCADQAALCAELGLTEVIFVGHDWGGLIVWQMPLRYPELTKSVICLNTPYTKRAPMEPSKLYAKRFGEDFYMVWFQEEGEAEALLDDDVRKTLTYFAQKPPEADGNSPDTRAGSSLKDTLKTFDTSTARPLVMSDEAFDFYVREFERTGFRGGINWYRNFDRNWHETANQVDLVEQPCLMVLAELDPVLPPAAADGMEKFVPNLDRVLIKGSGHWTQQEKPDDVNGAIADWVQKKF